MFLTFLTLKTLRIEAKCSPDMSDFFLTKRHYSPKKCTPQHLNGLSYEIKILKETPRIPSVMISNFIYPSRPYIKLDELIPSCLCSVTDQKIYI